MNRLTLRHILCPMDLSALSMNSLTWANAVARARSAELRAFHVVVTTGIVAPERLGSLERGEMMTKLREALVTVDSENSRTGAAVRQGDPGTQILQFAKSIAADVIVMGAAGAERPTRPIGSVTATVVARSDCPVLIVPTGRNIDRSRPGVFKQILCAVDLAPSSVSVIRQALSLAWETHGHVLCVCVMTEPDPSSSEIQKQLMAAIPPEARIVPGLSEGPFVERMDPWHDQASIPLRSASASCGWCRSTRAEHGSQWAAIAAIAPKARLHDRDAAAVGAPGRTRCRPAGRPDDRRARSA